jgi:hypothetical protein
MQPHTGAIITVINYLAPSIKLVPESFEGQTFTVQSTIYSSSGSFLHYKYHLVRTIRYNQKARELELEVGKDYICFLTVRYDLRFEEFEFIKHRHTYVREKFRIYRNSDFKALENFSGEYVSEDGHGHRIKGRRLTSKRLEFIDTFKDDQNPNGVRRKYDLQII